mmetsp:Transcript_89215/g.257239  ORF Transcript_89215/g.257239 Transcript_89215/m.257239 type:complete len:249 (+) Transcript_89215:1792-2538(+)
MHLVQLWVNGRGGSPLISAFARIHLESPRVALGVMRVKRVVVHNFAAVLSATATSALIRVLQIPARNAGHGRQYEHTQDDLEDGDEAGAVRARRCLELWHRSRNGMSFCLRPRRRRGGDIFGTQSKAGLELGLGDHGVPVLVHKSEAQLPILLRTPDARAGPDRRPLEPSHLAGRGLRRELLPGGASVGPNLGLDSAAPLVRGRCGLGNVVGLATHRFRRAWGDSRVKVIHAHLGNWPPRLFAANDLD